MKYLSLLFILFGCSEPIEWDKMEQNKNNISQELKNISCYKKNNILETPHLLCLGTASDGKITHFWCTATACGVQWHEQ